MTDEENKTAQLNEIRVRVIENGVLVKSFVPHQQPDQHAAEEEG